MSNTRIQKAKLNMVTTLLYQILAIVSGIVIPKIMISSFGSEAYGATTSITQFLSYVTLLEGGIGGVARAELYKPLAENDIGQISKIYNAERRVFRIIGGAFVVYTVVLAASFHKIADVTFLEPDYTFFLVIAISISTVAQYFFGIANLTLLNADQKRYISNIVMIVSTTVNALLVILLVKLDCDILTVKLCSSSIFILRPVFFSMYVKKRYKLDHKIKADREVLKQKWTGLGQHLAYYLHTNTDVAVLTLFANLKYVAVYSVYNLVVSSIKNIVVALTGGMEALFGDMIAKKEHKTLVATYEYYEMLISYVTLVLFGTAVILVVPFVRLYTKDVADAEYIQPAFAMIVLLAEAINCLFLPYSTLPVAANQFKQTRWGAYGEALINIVVSCILVVWNPLLGVAIGTALSVVYKSIFYFLYVNKNILRISSANGMRYILYILVLVAIAAAGWSIIKHITIDSAITWISCGFVVVTGVAIVVSVVYVFMHGERFVAMMRRLLVKFLPGHRG